MFIVVKRYDNSQKPAHFWYLKTLVVFRLFYQKSCLSCLKLDFLFLGKQSIAHLLHT